MLAVEMSTTRRSAELGPALEFVQSLCAAGARWLEGPERRSGPRCALAMVVDILPLDSFMVPCGSKRAAVTRDLSAHGIGLFADVPVETKFLLVWLPVGPAQRCTALVEVLRCAPLAFLFDVGGRFIDADQAALARYSSAAG